jgi:hypothetical protein
MTATQHPSDEDRKPTDRPRLPRRLPIVMIDGKPYFRDDRLREYRAVDNPHDRIAFQDAHEFLD